MIKWLDIIDQTELQALAKSYNLQLTNPTRSFLESFARLVHKAANTRQRLVNAAQARKTDLHTVNAIIAEEVSNLQQQYPQARIIPYRHPETTLPIVYVRIQTVPDLVVHIYRSYATTRRGLAFGFRAYSFCRGQLSGALARATNYLRARCNANSWNLSLSQLISLWCQQVDAIPVHERRPAPRTAKSQRMFRRRRPDKRPSPPPLVSDNNQHASIPQTHPETDAVIKDDKLFPNRTFDDPEELYAEQVRAIRKKRKAHPGVLDDYELAKKRRHPESHDDSPSEQIQPTIPSPPHPQIEPLSQPPASIRRSLFPFQSSPAEPSEPSAQEQVPANQPDPPEEPEFSFLNPLSPEMKDAGVDETPRSPTEIEALSEKPKAAEYDAAKMEAAERAVLSKPAEAKDSVSSQPPDPDTSNCIPVDNTPPLFFFTTGMDTDESPLADNVKATETVAEAVRHKDTQEHGDTPSPSERIDEAVVVAPPETEEAKVVAPRPKVTPQSQEDGERMLSAEEDTRAGIENKGSVLEPSFTFTGLIDDHGGQGEAEIDEPKTTGEERETKSNLNDPKDSSEQELDDSKVVSKSVSEKLESADVIDPSSKHDSASAGTEAPISTGPNEGEPETGDDPERPDVEDAKVDLEPVAAKEPKKRNREKSCSDDVIIIDPDPDEEKETSSKKRRLSLSPPRKPALSARHSAFSGAPGQENDGSLKDQERDAGSKIKSDGGEAPVREPAQPVERQRVDKLMERPSPRHVSVWTPEPSAPSPCTLRDKNDAKKYREAKPAEEAHPSTAKTVTPDVEQCTRPFSSVGALSIPAGVDRDPCPMALSEPSESSEYSSDRDSNSDVGSVSDAEPNINEP